MLSKLIGAFLLDFIEQVRVITNFAKLHEHIVVLFHAH